jgi:hypothetical protein
MIKSRKWAAHIALLGEEKCMQDFGWKARRKEIIRKN